MQRARRETDIGTVDRPVCYAPRAIRRTRENECGAMLIYMNNDTRRYCTTRVGSRLFPVAFHYSVEIVYYRSILALDTLLRFNRVQVSARS